MDPLKRLEIEHACARLIRVYCQAMDTHNVDRLLGVFAKDAVWQRPGNPPLKGHSDFREFAAHHGQGEVSTHYVTNIVVDVEDEDHASSSAYGLVFRGSGTLAEGPLPVALPRLVVQYQHKFIREEGEWRIKYKETRWLFRQRQE